MFTQPGQIEWAPKHPKTLQDRNVCQPPIMLMKAERGLSIRQVGTAMRARPHTNGLGDDDMGVMIRWHLQETFRAPKIGVASLWDHIVSYLKYFVTQQRSSRGNPYLNEIKLVCYASLKGGSSGEGLQITRTRYPS